ncbi:MAG: hypothetical protein K0Q57_178, partial [Gammaproteobacteria bacterium]|nr:hypothetical protein [Gammaproteobacteria bacterium]
MPQFNQSKPYYNLFDFTANLLRWAINNPLQFIVSALALQAIIASAKSSEGLTSERKSRNLAFASNDAVALQESGPWPYYFAGATLSNNRTVISYIPFVGSQDPKFRLFDANFNPVSETKQVSLTSGLLSITIPLENGGFSLINGVGGGKYIRYNSLGTAQIGPSQVGAYGYETIWSATRLTNDSIAVLLTHGNCIYGLTWVLVDTDSSPYYTKDYPVLATCDNVRTASIQKISNQRLAVLYREAEAGTEGLYMKAYDETSGNELIRQRVDLSSSTYKICSPAPANYHMFPYTALSSFGDGKTAIAWLCGETETAQICLRIMESDLSLSPTIQKLKISWTHNGLYLTTLLNGGFAAAWWKPYYDYRTSTSQDKLTVHHFNRTGSLVGAFAIPAAGYDFSYHSHIALVPNQPNQIEVFWSNGFSHQRFDLSASSQVMQLANPIPNQVTRSRTTYTYEVPLDTFSMPNLDQDLTYSVSPLPAWLEFDAQSQTFVGFPADADVANYPISLFARDNFGSEANATFNLNVKRFNRAPTVNALIPNRSGKVGLPFNYTVPSSVFSDADGDSLRYNASRADNSSLPVWLNFNTTSRRFSGVPAKQSEGLTDIKVIAEDDYDGSAFDIFTLDIASSLSAEMPAQNGGYIGRSFNLTGLTVASESSNNIAVQLSLSDLGAGGLSTPAAGTAISSFDADAGIWTVSGLPADVQAVLSQLAYLPASGYSGSFTINALIDDGINNVLTRSLTLGQRPNTAPVVAGSLANQEVTVGSALALTLPNGLFTDADSDQLTYSAALSNGNPLPSWLSFNPDTLHFSGSPQVSHVAELAITITATDIAQASSQFTFGLNVIMPAASASATATA